MWELGLGRGGGEEVDPGRSEGAESLLGCQVWLRSWETLGLQRESQDADPLPNPHKQQTKHLTDAVATAVSVQVSGASSQPLLILSRS